MELWIRSQDKTDFIKARSIAITKENYNETGFYVNGCLFGMYKTKERALSIINEIEQMMTLNEVISGDYKEQDLKLKSLYLQQSNLIFNLPEE